MNQKLKYIVFLLLATTNSFSQIIEKVGFIQTGKASYYTKSRDGAKTLSGEVFDHTKFEAGHNHLAFNSLIKVTNLENKQEVIVRINDRVYSNQRILDLTSAAADKLGFLEEKKVIFNVKIEVIKLGVTRKINKVLTKENSNIEAKVDENLKINNDNITSDTSVIYYNNLAFQPIATYLLTGEKAEVHSYGVQVAAFREVSFAIKKGKEFEKLALDKVYIQSGWKKNEKVFRVIIGDHKNEFELNTLKLKLEKLRRKSFLLKKHF